MYYVYVLESKVKKGKYYTGHSQDIDLRLKQHNAGKTKSTRPWKPWKVIYLETFETRIDAIQREKYLKSGFGRNFLKSILAP